MQLETNRLILRDFLPEDWGRVAEYRSNPLYSRYYPEVKSTEEEARSFVQRVIDWANESPRTRFQLAIVRASDGLLLGNCGVRGVPNRFASEAEFGCELDPQHWKHGYATEAGRAIIDFGFEQLHTHRVFARIFPENRSSAQLAERLGMLLEGRLRERRFFKERWWDHLIYAILEPEWHKLTSGSRG
jgi:RimJ/RimL family protein N-acetyltransferase